MGVATGASANTGRLMLCVVLLDLIPVNIYLYEILTEYLSDPVPFSSD